MKTLSRKDIGIIKMLTNPPTLIVNSGFKIINSSDGCIYEFINNKWNKINKASMIDYNNIPEII